MAVYESNTAEGYVGVGDITPPAVQVPGVDTPVDEIDSQSIVQLGQNLDHLFKQYLSDRRIAELRWLRNLRQYLGYYDPEIDKEMAPNRSRAYPKITRVKCVSVLSRLMNLMFPGNERNWALKGGPSAEMLPEDVQDAVKKQQEADQANGVQPPQPMTLEYILTAIKGLADKRAQALTELIDDQLEELGGDQTCDYIALNRRALQSGIIYGIGVLEGPYARSVEGTTWEIAPDGTPTPHKSTIFKPMFEFRSIWDFYPDMSAKTFAGMDGYFTRVVMSRSQVLKLAKRKDFFANIIKAYLQRTPMGNYRPQPFETELRSMGLKINVNEMKTETSKFEVIVWHGPIGGQYLRMAGVEVADDKLADEINSEVWMIGGIVIKADVNPWVKVKADVKTVHVFSFDEDDTSVIGYGLPNIIRDSQMSISAATRMVLDNASVTCGPNLELNTDLLRLDQDLSAIQSYKIWYREGTGPEAQWPAVRNVTIESHIDELLKMIDLFMKIVDAETFVGPATGGDMEKMPSEPMRTLGGASMIRGDAALPFKDIVRNFDQFTQSIIQSMVIFNRKFNPDKAQDGDYNVIARGATSLIAKELRGGQVDQLVTTLRPEELPHVNIRKMTEMRFAVRDLTDMLVSPEEAARRQSQQDQATQAQQQQQTELAEANARKLLSDAFKNIAQGEKNSAMANAASVDAALKILKQGMENELGVGGSAQIQQPAGGNPGDAGQPGALPAPGPDQVQPGGDQIGDGGSPLGGPPGPPGGMPGAQ